MENINREIVDKLTSFYADLGSDPLVASLLALISVIAVVLLISLLAFLVTKKIILRILAHYIRNNRFQWDNKLLERKVFHRLAHFIPAIIIYAAAPIITEHQVWIQRLASMYMIITGILVISALLSAAEDIYSSFKIAREKPIKGYLQGIKIFVFIVGAIIIIANLIGKSPVLLLSGIGAVSAVILLIFQDSILGLVAGIQLSANDMVRIGDWIEMPRFNADGDVIEISLTTVKVLNFDRTITTIPPRALVTDSFRNWRGMQEAGGRRIKRSINIDIDSIRFCDAEMIDDLRKIDLLQDYIDCRQKEISSYNQQYQVDETEIVNGRRMTNIGTFRAYLERYIASHPRIHQDMIHMVRQLPPNEHGLPLELYMFTRSTDWIIYENVQSDIFDHVLAAAPRFGLVIFQEPTGQDLRLALKNNFNQR